MVPRVNQSKRIDLKQCLYSAFSAVNGAGATTAVSRRAMTVSRKS